MGATGLAGGRSHAIRPWFDSKAYEIEDGVANETLEIYLSQIYGTEGIEISGVVVEPRRRYIFQKNNPGGESWMASAACPEDWLALYWHAKSFSLSRALAAHVTATRRKSRLGYLLFGSVARFPGILNGHKRLGLERTAASSLVPFQPF